MGGRGSGAVRNKATSMSIDNYQLQEKKWNEREKNELSKALKFMSDNFGDLTDLVTTIKRKEISGAAGMYDRATRTVTLTRMGAHTDNIVHEFTHSVTEEIAANYKSLGYNSRQEVMDAMQKEIYSNLGEKVPTRDKRKYWTRPEEEFSRTIEGLSHTEEKHSKHDYETMNVIQKWFKKVRK